MLCVGEQCVRRDGREPAANGQPRTCAQNMLELRDAAGQPLTMAQLKARQATVANPSHRTHAQPHRLQYRVCCWGA